MLTSPFHLVSIPSTAAVIDFRHSFFSGTSMATPHTAGLAALLRSHAPSMTGAQIKDRILSTVVKTSALDTKTVARGRINCTALALER